MNWFSPEHIVETFGALAVFAVAAIIFLETATIIGSILPGDSLLFILGLGLATHLASFPLTLALPLLFISAATGTQVGYWVGHRVGPRLFSRNRGWFFNQTTVSRTKNFFAKFGSRAVVLARFMPVLRAVVPMFAGIANMDRRLFFFHNLLGALAWSVGLTAAGYALGMIDWVRENIELIVVSFVVLSSLPLPFELLRHNLAERKKRSTQAV